MEFYENRLKGKFQRFLNRIKQGEPVDDGDGNFWVFIPFYFNPNKIRTNFIFFRKISDLGLIYLIKIDENMEETKRKLNLDNQTSTIHANFKLHGREYQYVSKDGNQDLWAWFLLYPEFNGGTRKQMLESLTRPKLLALVKKYQVTTCSLKDTKNVLVNKMRKWKEKYHVRFVM
jgi:hypothetical protein